MEAGLVSNHNMMRLRIACAKVFKEELIASVSADEPQDESLY